jgi:hypothetical protein
MTATREEVQRIIELIDQGSAAGDRKEDVVRRIAKEIPHLTVADVVQVVSVRAEEFRLDASVQLAGARAADQIATIMKQTQELTGRSGLTTQQTVWILWLRAQDGDERAAKLLDDLDEAFLVFGTSE